jgi:hypothetical protein
LQWFKNIEQFERKNWKLKHAENFQMDGHNEVMDDYPERTEKEGDRIPSPHNWGWLRIVLAQP